MWWWWSEGMYGVRGCWWLSRLLLTAVCLIVLLKIDTASLCTSIHRGRLTVRLVFTVIFIVVINKISWSLHCLSLSPPSRHADQGRPRAPTSSLYQSFTHSNINHTACCDPDQLLRGLGPCWCARLG